MSTVKDMADLDPLSSTSLYEQVAQILIERIRSGRYEPGRPIPSETTLMQELEISRPTARRAVAYLRERGWVFTIPKRASYVTAPDNWPDDDEGSSLTRHDH